MEKLLLLLLAMLLRVNLTESCKKSKPQVVYQNVTSEDDTKLNQSDIAHGMGVSAGLHQRLQIVAVHNIQLRRLR